MIVERKRYVLPGVAVFFFSTCFFFLPGNAVFGENFRTDFFSIPCSGNTGIFGTKDHVRLCAVSDNTDFTLPETSSQKIIKKIPSANRAEITFETGINTGYTAKPVNADTEKTRYINLDDPKLADLARTIMSGSTRATIDGIRTTVYKYIAVKKSGMPLISSKEILSAQAGDCKQHTVLAIALLRRKSIPARAIIGLVYQKEFNGSKDRFVFHMWAEAFDGKSWVICDAAFPPDANKASQYLAISYHSLKSESPLDYTAAISNISNLRIAVQ